MSVTVVLGFHFYFLVVAKSSKTTRILSEQKSIRLELFHKILFLKADLNLHLLTAKAIVEKPCVQVKQFEITVEPSY